jgi:hypothetical protein
MEATKPAQSGFDFCLSSMRPIIAADALRYISHLPPPPLSASERTSAGRHPQHHATLIEIGAHKEPLPALKMSRACLQLNPLVQLLDLNA